MSEDIVGVEQVDRDAAAEYAMRFLRWNRDVVDAMDEGRADEDPLIQLLARHRIAAQLTPEPSAAVDLEGVVCTYCGGNGYSGGDMPADPDLRGEYDFACEVCGGTGKLKSAAHTNRGEVERLREALDPFAELADNFVGEDEDDDDLYSPPLYEHQMRVRIGWLRAALAARAALSSPDTVKDVSDA